MKTITVPKEKCWGHGNLEWSLLMNELGKGVEPKPEHYTKMINTMLNSEDYYWAEETLEGIKDTIEITEEVTEGQIKAIMNIRRASY